MSIVLSENSEQVVYKTKRIEEGVKGKQIMEFKNGVENIKREDLEKVLNETFRQIKNIRVQ